MKKRMRSILVALVIAAMVIAMFPALLSSADTMIRFTSGDFEHSAALNVTDADGSLLVSNGMAWDGSVGFAPEMYATKTVDLDANPYLVCRTTSADVPYSLYVQVGSDTATREWLHAGPYVGSQELVEFSVDVKTLLGVTGTQALTFGFIWMTYGGYEAFAPDEDFVVFDALGFSENLLVSSSPWYAAEDFEHTEAVRITNTTGHGFQISNGMTFEGVGFAPTMAARKVADLDVTPHLVCKTISTDVPYSVYVQLGNDENTRHWLHGDPYAGSEALIDENIDLRELFGVTGVQIITVGVYWMTYGDYTAYAIDQDFIVFEALGFSESGPDENSDPSESTPSDPSESTPSDPSESTPSDPSEPDESTPSDSSEPDGESEPGETSEPYTPDTADRGAVWPFLALIALCAGTAIGVASIRNKSKKAL